MDTFPSKVLTFEKKNFTRVCIWATDLKKLENISERLNKKISELDIGNVILNSKDYPYFNFVLNEAIKFPKEKFKIVIYVKEYKEAKDHTQDIEKIINSTLSFLKANGIHNLELEIFNFTEQEKERNKKFVDMGSLIDKIKVFTMLDFIQRGYNVGIFDFDNILHHDDVRINAQYEKESLVLFNYEYYKGNNDFAPAICLFAANQKNIKFLKNIVEISEKLTNSYFNIHTYFKLAILLRKGSINNEQLEKYITQIKNEKQNVSLFEIKKDKETEGEVSKKYLELCVGGKVPFVLPIESLSENNECLKGETWKPVNRDEIIKEFHAPMDLLQCINRSLDRKSPNFAIEILHQTLEMCTII